MKKNHNIFLYFFAKFCKTLFNTISSISRENIYGTFSMDLIEKNQSLFASIYVSNFLITNYNV